jgi:subtilisin-like proprotein convertase family protein
VVSLEGEGSHDGVTVTAQPGGHSTVTAADGSYLLTGLDAGAYTITAERDGFSVGSLALTLGEGEHRGEVDFALGIVYEVTECAQPALSIPDNDATGVSSTVEVTMSGEVTSVRAFVDITHTYQGDLRVQLTSPSGTTVILHDRSGSSADNILGWYPDDLGPAGNLDAFLGEEMQGAWRLTVSDHAGWDTGTLDEWCVNIGYSGGTTTAADGLPTVLSLGRNFPNPFNPQTTIDFAVPRAGRVSLAVFDLRGRRVAELVNGDLTAGHHEVTWRGQDDTGRQVASGTYFYRLTADNETRTGKMLLVK